MKLGVGAAIDAYVMNAAYFTSLGVPVLGAIFNRGDNEGFYRYAHVDY